MTDYPAFPFARHPDAPPCAVCGVRRGEWLDDQGRCPECRPGWRERWPLGGQA